jgi:hypothetical protein
VAAAERPHGRLAHLDAVHVVQVPGLFSSPYASGYDNA